MTTSKSFRAILPPLSEEEVRRLRAWSAENCAAATVFRESECVVWLASKERARSREAFLRSVRGVLKRLAIDVTRLRGRWLVLAEDGVVQAGVLLEDPTALLLQARGDARLQVVRPHVHTTASGVL